MLFASARSVCHDLSSKFFPVFLDVIAKSKLRFVNVLIFLLQVIQPHIQSTSPWTEPLQSCVFCSLSAGTCIRGSRSSSRYKMTFDLTRSLLNCCISRISACCLLLKRHSMKTHRLLIETSQSVFFVGCQGKPVQSWDSVSHSVFGLIFSQGRLTLKQYCFLKGELPLFFL